MNRYDTLLEIVRDQQPRHIVEIGTWNGERACQMMAMCDCYYTGFDLFEDATKETDLAEFNVKQHNELVPVAQRIEMAGFSKFQLIRGNTKETLREWEYEPFDFVFIDGGHSIETIENDYNWAKFSISEGGTIILDDYYKPEIVGMGCNFMADDGEILEVSDPVKGGGRCHLVRVVI